MRVLKQFFATTTMDINGDKLLFYVTWNVRVIALTNWSANCTTWTIWPPMTRASSLWLASGGSQNVDRYCVTDGRHSDVNAIKELYSEVVAWHGHCWARVACISLYNPECVEIKYLWQFERIYWYISLIVNRTCTGVLR